MTTICSSCIILQKKHKVLTADYEFQIKKIQQDKSTQKALYELNTNKQLKKLTQKLSKQKQQRWKQNQNWINKYDQLIERNQKQIDSYRLKKDAEVQEFKKTKEKQLEQFKKDKVQGYQRQIAQLKQKALVRQTELLEQSSISLHGQQQKHERIIFQIRKKHDEQLYKKCNFYQCRIVGLSSQKTVQQNLHRKTKQQSRQQHSRLMQQIYLLKRSIYDCQSRITTLQEQLSDKQGEIDELKKQIQQKIRCHQQRQQQLLKDYEYQNKIQVQKMQQKLNEVLKRQLLNCNKYEQMVEKMEEQRNIQRKQYDSSLEQVRNWVEGRPSRVEDVEQIAGLRIRLAGCQKVAENCQQQLKWCRLQLENKEQVYGRIFGQRNNQNLYGRRKEKLKRNGKSVTLVRDVLANVNYNGNSQLGPLVGAMEKKLLPPKHNKIL